MEEPLSDKKVKFKEFVKDHPELITDMKKHNHTWKDLFDAYQLFGDEADIWKVYRRPTKSKGFDMKDTFKKVTDYLQNMDGESLKQHLTMAESLLGDLQGFMTSKKTDNETATQPQPQQQRPQPLQRQQQQQPYYQNWFYRPSQPPGRPR